MQKTILISDIHGELKKFQELLNLANYSPDEDRLVLLGDYIDRGPNSADVLDLIMKLQQNGAIVLIGNHENLMEKAFTEKTEYAWKHWTERCGGKETLLSYGFSKEEIQGIGEGEQFTVPQLQSKKLDEHLAFIKNLHIYIEDEDYIFVHAGIDPHIPVSETEKETLIWIREEFYNGYTGSKTIVFGHTPTSNLHQSENNHNVYFGQNNIIGIDGGAVFGGQLNCLELPSKRICFIK
ncbi:metallophosphoesterase family protein [Viridibacillus sp. FSL H8-0123]|uniref:metallophosphoesterase family protein n=1 Tax=Viridibacillus sp. FSL H8-0123 TaxID=1928922 RepID=UPI00096C8D61|nr:metallophosphoesterase family protein [Viridibacillus sp. FSL H8-0123]OMC81504.1 serine/threonine protein phosphatase [Viridibacillus sp. FSL H8-0123]